MNTTAQAIYSHYEKKNSSEKPRPYIGWSSIGRPCDRELWLKFRAAFNDGVEGRIARLFDTGHREEDRVLNELKAIGCTVHSRDSKTGKQFAVQSHGGHMRGHADAVVSGLPEDPKTVHLVDVKTINHKKYAQLLKVGMKTLIPAYYAQGQGYMGHLGLTRAMFIFICKDSDSIHCEFFDFDQSEFEKYEKKAGRIIFADRAPPRLSEDPSWFECKFCSANDLCHGSKLTKEVNCRTCANSTAMDDGTWHCQHWDMTIPDLNSQLAGCDNHVLHPDMTPGWEMEGTNNGVIWLTKEGPIHNAPEGYLSREIVANWQACASGVREKFSELDARVVG